MYELNGIKMFSADDIKTAFHVSKETAYKLIKSKNANAKYIGRKLLISEDNLKKILNNVKL